jgi:hypothetical protein
MSGGTASCRQLLGSTASRSLHFHPRSFPVPRLRNCLQRIGWGRLVRLPSMMHSCQSASRPQFTTTWAISTGCQLLGVNHNLALDSVTIKSQLFQAFVCPVSAYENVHVARRPPKASTNGQCFYGEFVRSVVSAAGTVTGRLRVCWKQRLVTLRLPDVGAASRW